MKTGLAIVMVALLVGCGAEKGATASEESGASTGTPAESSSGVGDGSSEAEGSTGVDPSSSDTGSDVPAACVDAGWSTSLAAYEALADTAGDTYWYAINSYEYIDDFQWGCMYRTTIEYVAGAPTRRTFELADVAEGTTEDECSGTPFVEESDAIGSMDGIYDVAPRTMPELYAGCCDLLALEPPDAYSFHFEVADDGVVDSCYAIENGCGEGCEASVDGFSGFSFEMFGFGSLP